MSTIHVYNNELYDQSFVHDEGRINEQTTAVSPIDVSHWLPDVSAWPNTMEFSVSVTNRINVLPL